MLRDDLAGIVCDLADEDLSPVIITNGTLLTESRLREFPEGSVFEVTLFGASPDLHNLIAGNSVFDDVLEGLLNLEKHKCRLVLVAVITRLNAHDIGRTIELGIALGATAVLLNRVNMSRHMLPVADRVVPSVSCMRRGLDAAQGAAVKYGIRIAISVPVPPCLIEPEDYPDLHFGWCPRGGENSYYTVGCEGFLRPCNHSSVVLGDLWMSGFGEIVSGQKAKQFWSAVPDECLECAHPLKDACAGGCPAAADECYGTPRRKDPFVEYACAAASTGVE
jgi:radical SAM protein with 4Fe4S-binding SPASM domain